jgi:hypothetical protein
MGEVAQQFEAWRTEDGVVLGTLSSIAEQRAKGLLSSSAQHLYSISACTWEEAQAIHHLRMGFEPYKPQGPASPCPKCNALLYPEGSAQCWQCGFIAHAA